MADLEEVISSLPEENNYLLDDIQYVIDENLRTIAIPPDGVVLGVVGDRNVNRVNFQMPKYYNGFDMSTFKCRINYSNANGDLNFYDVKDLTIIDDLIYFTWLVDGTAAAYVGETKFVVRLYKTEGTKVVQNFYSTYNTASVLEGLLVDETVDDIEDVILHLQRLSEEYIYDTCEPILEQYLIDHVIDPKATKKQIAQVTYSELLYHLATEDDIKNIIADEYTPSGTEDPSDEHYCHIAEQEDIDTIIDNLW